MWFVQEFQEKEEREEAIIYLRISFGASGCLFPGKKIWVRRFVILIGKFRRVRSTLTFLSFISYLQEDYSKWRVMGETHLLDSCNCVERREAISAHLFDSYTPYVFVMGNCFRSPAQAPVSKHTPPSTTGFSSNFSTSVGVSGTSSSPGISQFSDAVNIDIKEPNWNGQILLTSHLKVFTLSELKAATKDFKFDAFLGEGGFGKVYKGMVDGKTLAPSKSATAMVVAIKKLNSESVQGFREWQAEVNFLGRLSHPNLVKLLGYCREDAELLLVYEFMPKGSLENHLFRRNPSIEPLSWQNRLKIAIGAAKGLAFLHTSEKHIIYRDFKASNILLDANYDAKISDFGLAKLGPSGEATHVTTRIMGTAGYAAPEYVSSGHLYVKSDVYGFGVVLLELLTGLRAQDSSRPSEQRNLVNWLSPVLIERKKIKTIMDRRIEGQYSSKASSLVADVTVRCLESDPRNRPSMIEVVEALEPIEIKERQKHKKSAKLIIAKGYNAVKV